MGSAVFCKPDSEGYFDPPYDWRRRPGGGPILINMVHEVGNLRAMVGEIVAVQAFASNATRGFEVEDTVAINLRFQGGALGTFLLSDTAASPRSWEQTSRENEAYATYDDEDAYVIIGTRGSLRSRRCASRTMRGRGSLLVQAVPDRPPSRSIAPIRSRARSRTSARSFAARSSRS